MKRQIGFIKKFIFNKLFSKELEACANLHRAIYAIATPIFFVDSDMVVRCISDAALEFFGYSREQVIGKMQCSELCKTEVCGTNQCPIRESMQTGKPVTKELMVRTPNQRKIPVAAMCNAFFDEHGNPLGASKVIYDLSDQKNALNDIRELINNIEDGQLKKHLNPDKVNGDLRDIILAVNNMLDKIIAPVEEAVTTLEKMSNGDLESRMQGDYKGDHAKIKDSVNRAIENVNFIMQQVSQSSAMVAMAADQIGNSSQGVAQGASEQASTLEEVSGSLHELSSMSKQNADNAREAKKLTDATRQSSDEGMKSMRRLSEAINRIKASSDDTAKIVKTIDEIAFQTNLLALNAAVEAARAGDAGKGFAVVAEEVRNLAIRSAEAAQNTSHLIEESVKNATIGVDANQDVVKNLEKIREQVNKVSEVMTVIAGASELQQDVVEQINKAIDQLNQVTQQNAANSEESASAAEELASQSAELKRLVSIFKLSGQNGEFIAHREPPASVEAETLTIANNENTNNELNQKERMLESETMF